MARKSKPADDDNYSPAARSDTDYSDSEVDDVEEQPRRSIRLLAKRLEQEASTPDVNEHDPQGTAAEVDEDEQPKWQKKKPREKVKRQDAPVEQPQRIPEEQAAQHREHRLQVGEVEHPFPCAVLLPSFIGVPGVPPSPSGPPNAQLRQPSFPLQPQAVLVPPPQIVFVPQQRTVYMPQQQMVRIPQQQMIRTPQPPVLHALPQQLIHVAQQQIMHPPPPPPLPYPSMPHPQQQLIQLPQQARRTDQIPSAELRVRINLLVDTIHDLERQRMHVANAPADEVYTAEEMVRDDIELARCRAQLYHLRTALLLCEASSDCCG